MKRLLGLGGWNHKLQVKVYDYGWNTQDWLGIQETVKGFETFVFGYILWYFLKPPENAIHLCFSEFKKKIHSHNGWQKRDNTEIPLNKLLTLFHSIRIIHSFHTASPLPHKS